MPARVQKEAEAMCGTMTAFSQSVSPGFVSGSSSNTSSPHLNAGTESWLGMQHLPRRESEGMLSVQVSGIASRARSS